MARSRHWKVLSQIAAGFGSEQVRGAEIGTLRGDTSRRLLERHPNLFLIMVDNWQPPPASAPYASSEDSAALQSSEKHLANMALAYQQTAFAEDRRDLIRCSSLDAANLVPDQSLDFAFVDADHTYQGVRNDLRAWWPKVRSGGILCGHDYNSPKDQAGLWGVRRAVDEFAVGHGLTPEQHQWHVWSVQKPVVASPEHRNGSSDPVVVRVLFGEPEDFPKLARQVQATLKSDWCRDRIVHATASKGYLRLLQDAGATRVLNFHDRYHDERASHPDRHAKPYLMRRVMDSHSEILFLDFDCRVHRLPDFRLWDAIREKRGRFGGELQAASVCYRRRSRLRIHPGGRTQRIRKCLNSSVIYCSDSSWIDRWLEAYSQLREWNIDLTGKGDETPLLYSIERKFGMLTPDVIARDFELSVHSIRKKGLVEKDAASIYFSHR